MSDWTRDSSPGSSSPDAYGAPSADAAGARQTGDQQHGGQYGSQQYGQTPTYDQGGYGQQQQYGQTGAYEQGYGSQYGAPMAPAANMQYSQQSVDADKAVTLSLVFGILGVVLMPIIFGPLALWQAGKAERLGKPATAGKVLGWIGTILAVLSIVAIILFVVLGLASIGSMSTV